MDISNCKNQQLPTVQSLCFVWTCLLVQWLYGRQPPTSDNMSLPLSLQLLQNKSKNLKNTVRFLPHLHTYIIKLYQNLLHKGYIPTGHVLFLASLQSFRSSLYCTAYFLTVRPPLSAGPTKENVIVVAATRSKLQIFNLLTDNIEKRTAFPVHAMLACCGSGNIILLIINHSTR